MVLNCNHTTIDPRGDVRLLLHDGELTVSRKALCLSSPVFLAMLGESSKFAEALDKDPDGIGVRTVSLGEDNYETMKILMCIIHHRNDTVPLEVTFEQLNDIAVVCDKYDLRNCILAWSTLWSRPYLGCAEKPGFESWLFISVVFRNEEMFTRITKHLILNATTSECGTLSFGTTNHLSEGVPEIIIDQMKHQKATTVEALHKLLQDHLLGLTYGRTTLCCSLQEKQTECNILNIGSLVRAFPFLCDEQALSDAESWSISANVERIQNIATYGTELRFHQWNRAHNTGDHAECGLREVLIPKAKSILQSMQALNLPAYRSSRTNI